MHVFVGYYSRTTDTKRIINTQRACYAQSFTLVNSLTGFQKTAETPLDPPLYLAVDNPYFTLLEVSVYTESEELVSHSFARIFTKGEIYILKLLVRRSKVKVRVAKDCVSPLHG